MKDKMLKSQVLKQPSSTGERYVKFYFLSCADLRLIVLSLNKKLKPQTSIVKKAV